MGDELGLTCGAGRGDRYWVGICIRTGRVGPLVLKLRGGIERGSIVHRVVGGVRV